MALADDKTRRRAYYQKNREKILLARKEYVRRNKARVYKATEEWRKANRARVNSTTRRRVAKDPERYREYKIKHKYGLSMTEYSALLNAQNNGCAICGTTIPGGKGKSKLTAFYVDHNHNTKLVRGLLCHHCNFGLGHFKDSTEFLAKAISYLSDPPALSAIGQRAPLND